MALTNAERQARWRASRRKGFKWSDEHGARVNPEPHEPSDAEYKAGCGCGPCRDAHALYERLRYHADTPTGPMPLADLERSAVTLLARMMLDRVEHVPPPPPIAAPEQRGGGRHRRAARHRADA